jgi:hypothetical protein
MAGRIRERLPALAGMLFLFATSCAPPLEYGEVDGQVSLNDKPLIGVVVRFYPVSEQKDQLPYATAVTDATGKYRLTQGDGKPGAVIGRNRVVVKWPSRDMVQEGTPSGPPPDIPLRYTVVTESPLSFDVKPGQQSINLQLSE